MIPRHKKMQPMANSTRIVRPPRRGRQRKLKKAISHLRRPEELSLEQWQIALRKQMATQQRFAIENVGGEAVFSEFRVSNPQTKRIYRVAIRGREVEERV